MTVEARLAGTLLREARQRAGLTQVELARRGGVRQSVVSAYESGARQPSLPTLARLIEAGGMRLDVQVRRRRGAGISRLTGPLGRRVRASRADIVTAVAAHGARNVRVFGSVARGQDTADSDVDLVVDIPHGMSLIGLGRLESDLRELLNTDVDLVPSDGLKPDVAAAVLAEAISL